MEESVTSFGEITSIPNSITCIHAVCFSKVAFKLLFFLKDSNSCIFPTGEYGLDMFIGKTDTAAAGLIKRLPHHIKRQ